MLQQLCIKNFAIVRAMIIEFKAGLSVITGETGAGKSIMVGALGMVLGDRADTGVIRDGADKADISAIFTIQDKPLIITWLEEQQLETDSCILRRVISKDGRSKAYINGIPCTLKQLKIFGETLTDIHSQHEHQSLLQTSTHRILLDDFAGSSSLASQVLTSCNNWVALNKQLEQLITANDEQQTATELFKYQLEELITLNLQEGELKALEHEQIKLANAESTLQQGHQIIGHCIGAETNSNQQTSCLELLSQALRACEQITDNHQNLTDCTTMLNDARIQIEEASSSIQSYLDTVQLNPALLQQTEQRLADIHQLARKHKVPPSELLEITTQLTLKLNNVEHNKKQLDDLTAQLNNELTNYHKLAAKLTKMRIASIKPLSILIETQLAALGMGSTKFVIDAKPITTQTPATFGMETIEFLISPNPGQKPRPLQKIASGGELSRISLAIQVISAQTSTIPTLIFDEVDVGIGGATAEVVGNLLRKLGEAGQVICVTHQPQVASRAHHHMVASKTTNSIDTDSKIIVLTEAERIKEIARMLGGIDISKQTLAHAEQMLNLKPKEPLIKSGIKSEAP